MTTPDVLVNLAIGVIGGVIASVLTLLGDRWLHRATITRRLRRIAGNYRIVTLTPMRDTSAERVTIRQVNGRRFSVTAVGGPTGDWTGDFVVREDFFDVGYGIYRYPRSTDWGQHELLFDESSDSIFVYGVNRSKPGLMEPFSYTFVRWHGSEAVVAQQPVAADGALRRR